MANHLTKRYNALAAHYSESCRGSFNIRECQYEFAATHPTVALRYRAQVYRARRARAVLVASAADEIGRAL
jgi:hypothetical protein